MIGEEKVGVTILTSAEAVGLSLECGLHASKGGVQIAADALDNRDNRDRDAGGNQAIFNRGCTGVIAEKTQHMAHVASPLVTVAHSLVVVRTRRQTSVQISG